MQGEAESWGSKDPVPKLFHLLKPQASAVRPIMQATSAWKAPNGHERRARLTPNTQRKQKSTFFSSATPLGVFLDTRADYDLGGFWEVQGPVRLRTP